MNKGSIVNTIVNIYVYAIVTCTFQECHIVWPYTYIYTQAIFNYDDQFSLLICTHVNTYVRRYKSQKKRTSTVLKGNGEDSSHANLQETEPDLQTKPAYVSLELGQFNDTATYVNL